MLKNELPAEERAENARRYEEREAREAVERIAAEEERRRKWAIEQAVSLEETRPENLFALADRIYAYVFGAKG